MASGRGERAEVVKTRFFDYHTAMTKKPSPVAPVSMGFCVLGYGIPKDMSEDLNYQIYLRTVFNGIFEACAQANVWNPVIVFCGGKTDMWAPYRRTEAQEMKRVFGALMKRPVTRPHTRAWKLLTESTSLSTLDNLLYTKELMERGLFSAKHLTIFCEQTRVDRVKAIARKLFTKARVHPIDFDQSDNRYLDPMKLHYISKGGLSLDMRALKSERVLAAHRTLFKEKLAFLRKAGPDVHVETVRQWWDIQLTKIEKL